MEKHGVGTSSPENEPTETRHNFLCLIYIGIESVQIQQKNIQFTKTPNRQPHQPYVPSEYEVNNLASKQDKSHIYLTGSNYKKASKQRGLFVGT